MRRVALILVAVLGLARGAEALTVRDIIELSRAGLGEDVLLALIEVDRGVYRIDTSTLKSLKEAGVPERVIVALVRSGRERVAEPAPVPPAVSEEQAPEPQVVVIDHREEPRVREVMVPVPIYVPFIPIDFRHHRRVVDGHRLTTESTFVPFQSVRQPETPRQPKSEPVYWGFGGKLRPDAWQPDHKSDPDRHDADGQKPRRNK